MAGHISVEDSLEEDYYRPAKLSFDNLISPNHNPVQSSPSSQPATPSTTRPQNSLITTPPAPLELRQDNPQDCSNLIIASVNRATVEISRTIIALNATFAQQLQQASISASNGIKSAQGSASSTIAVVVQSASVATSSAFSSLTIANLAANTASSALTSVQLSASDAISSANLSIAAASSSLTSVSSASISDVSRLSSSLTLLQASLASVQSSASAAISAAQSALASVTGSAAAQASSILASAAPQTGSPGSLIQPLPALQASSAVDLTPAQAAATVAGTSVVSILLSFAIYFLVIRMKKRKERDSYLDEKSLAGSPIKLPSRSSATFRTGNGITIRFNPPKSSDAPVPSRSALRRPEDFPIASLFSTEREREPSLILIPEIDHSISSSPHNPWPLTLGFIEPIEMPSSRPPSPDPTPWPLNFNAVSYTDSNPTAPSAPESTEKLPQQGREINLASPIPITTTASLSPRKPNFSTPEKPIEDPFADPIEEKDIEHTIEKLPMKQSNQTPTEEPDEVLTVEEPVDEGPFADPEGNFLGQAVDPFGKLFEQPIEFEANENFQKAIENAISDEPALEQLPQESERLQAPEDFDSLQEDEQPMPEDDTLLHMVEQQNEAMGADTLFASDFRIPDLEVERVMPPAPLREEAEARRVSPQKRDTDGSVITERQRERVLSQLRQKPVVDAAIVQTEVVPPELHQDIAAEQREPSPPQPMSIAEREISPLQRNPHVQNIDSILVENSTGPKFEPTDEPESDDRGMRGRSMIRMSDIVESRLSRVGRIVEDEVSLEESERTISPLRQNPVDPAIVLSRQRDKTFSPLRRNPSVGVRKSRSPSPSLHPNLFHVPIPAAIHIREDSPVGGVAQHQYTSSLLVSDSKTVPAPDNASRPSGNPKFSQVLSKFQTLATKNPNDAIKASAEVTQRAIAGIFIPGSLREQAVRNSSKSRDKGRNADGGMAKGVLSGNPS